MRIPGWLALAVVAAVGYAIYYGYNRLGVPDIPLCVVNTSSDAPLEIRLNGKKAGQASRMIGEDPAAALMAVLKEGENQLEARDGSGAVVASETVVVTKDSNGYLWTPLPDPSFAFQIQTSEYTESGGSEYWSPLEGSGPLRPLPEWVSHWFRETPRTVSVPKGWKATHERALRRTVQ